MIKYGDRARVKDFMTVSGIAGSAWEHMVLESFFDIPSVSAARLLKMAHEQGMPIYTITKDNMGEMLSQLQVSEEVIADIINSVNTGKRVIIPKANIQYNDWNGVGYIVYDPVRGSGAYMISRGTAGADTSRPLPESAREIDALYRRICKQKREIILDTASSLIGTPYKMGEKFPRQRGEVDCSGLVGYCYFNAGITRLFTIDAAGQFAATKSTFFPLIADMVFFKGTYDKNKNCIRNEVDGVTHVGIMVTAGFMIDASSSRGVTMRPVLDFPQMMDVLLYKELAINKDGSIKCPQVAEAFKNGQCTGSRACYRQESTGEKYETFVGYTYAQEFDACLY